MSKRVGTLADFADWLGTMPADKEYDYTKMRECAQTQYLRARGLPCLWSGYGYWHDKDIHRHAMGKELFHVAAVEGPFTFGAAHKRALGALSRADS